MPALHNAFERNARERPRAGMGSAAAYDLLERIGTGSYASVFRARDRANGQEVAVKLLPKPHDANTSGLASLQVEIEALRRCKSDHVVSLFAAFEHDASIWLVMQYCLASVADVLRASPAGRLHEEDIAAICRGTLLALVHLHELLFIHRDVKPQNILISQMCTPMLADLGVSAQLSSDASRRGTVIGSPLYLAPEMIVSGSYDQRCAARIPDADVPPLPVRRGAARRARGV